MSLADGKKLYAVHCAGCHGADAHGTAQAPNLQGNRRLRGRSTDQLRAVIQHGVPAAGMPAFNLPGQELDLLARFVHSLNSSAVENALSGNPTEGEQLFFGKAQCSSCHMVQGRGHAIGPDLSKVGRELTAAELEKALLHPDRNIAPGYEIVRVQLRNGQSIEGFVRGRTNFDLQLQDFEGRFHLLQTPEISSVDEEMRSLMKPPNVAPAELQNILAYLSRLTGVEPGVSQAAAAKDAARVDFAKIRNPPPGDWLTYNGNLNANRYSELHQIDTANIAQLAAKWIFPISHFGLETTPVVAGGVMYVTGPNQAFALDARTGRQIWRYSRPRAEGLSGDASLGTNRGAALLGNNVFMVTDNAHLIALNRTTGVLVWEVVMPDEPQHYGSTIAPLVVKNTIIAGVSGGDWGIRGFIACYDASTGKRIWRHWTIPAKGEPGYDTWIGRDPSSDGGGATWLTGSYDAETDTLYWPTGNPFPDSDDSERGGDNLFTNCILALNPATGELKWHYQFTPHDVRDRDATEPPVLVDTRYQGRERKLLLHADRNGFFYVLDRTNGQLLLSKKFLHKVNWASGIGPDGRPQLSARSAFSSDHEMGCPGDAANWGSTAFSPVTRLYYFMSLEECRPDKTAAHSLAARQPTEAGQKYLRAVAIDTGKVAWEIPQIGPVLMKTWPGVLATAGGLVFYADPNGSFAAVDERTGKPLWHFPTNVLMKASPMTYMIDGKQFIAVAAGPAILCFGLP
jgi:PQQ-dependent dehydrogenase (methanol/ethanol family)